jgi:hypothetical protein
MFTMIDFLFDHIYFTECKAKFTFLIDLIQHFQVEKISSIMQVFAKLTFLIDLFQHFQVERISSSRYVSMYSYCHVIH